MTQQPHPEPATDVVDPGLPVIDPHHHLWIHGGKRYLIEEFQADLASGHDVRATVFVECSAMYRRTGPLPLRSVGEAEFVAGVAAMSDSGLYGPTRICAGFVGAADLAQGAAAGEVLDALAVASGGRLRGIRGAAIHDPHLALDTPERPYAPPGLLLDARFRAGFAQLARRKLVYDAWQFHPQLADVGSLADAFPDTPIVVNHCGGLLGLPPYTGAEAYAHWKKLVTELARRPNVVMKLGGLSSARCGFGFEKRPARATVTELVATWKPYIEPCIEAFGPARCMFESNFPVDGIAGDYRTVWNAYKLIAASCSPADKQDLFSGTARRVYRLD